MDSIKNFTDDLSKILSQAMKNKLYGSVEVYFEEGNVTQITQRIINKVKRPKNPKNNKSS
jgi:hypothetical protein